METKTTKQETTNRLGPTEILLNSIEVVNSTEVKKITNVTAKMLGAFKEQITRIKESKILNEEEMKQLEESANLVRTRWIEKNM